jgi:hypothetical protein
VLNNLSIGFLRTYGKPLVEILITITTASFILEYFPTRFRYVEVVILIKLKKIGKILYILGAYKSIALFNSINKIIEKTIDERIAIIIKKYNLFS